MLVKLWNAQWSNKQTNRSKQLSSFYCAVH